MFFISKEQIKKVLQLEHSSYRGYMTFLLILFYFPSSYFYFRAERKKKLVKMTKKEEWLKLTKEKSKENFDDIWIIFIWTFWVIQLIKIKLMIFDWKGIWRKSTSKKCGPCLLRRFFSALSFNKILLINIFMHQLSMNIGIMIHKDW